MAKLGLQADALAVPDTWSDQPDKLHAQMFEVPLSSPEAMAKISQWKETLGASPPRVVSLYVRRTLCAVLCGAVWCGLHCRVL